MHSQLKRRSHTPRISVGDVVIIHNDQPRAMWKLGLVEELLVGADGEKIAAVLRVSGQERELKRLRRPVQKLHPIEMAVESTEQNVKNRTRSQHTTPVQQPDGEQSPVQRPDDEPQRQPRRELRETELSPRP